MIKKGEFESKKRVVGDEGFELART